MARTRASRNGPVTVTRLADPQAWQDALRRAGGDHRRLRVVDYHTVVVVNQPERARHARAARPDPRDRVTKEDE